MSKYSQLAAIIAGLALPACVTTPEDLGSSDQAIVGGVTANVADFPSVVALENGPSQWFCTGTLIAPQWVLTAAHCVAAGEGSPAQTAQGLKIRFDDNDVTDTGGGREVAVAEIHSNPAFDFAAWDNDIALVKLAQPVTDRTPTPILRDAVAFGTRVTDVGYGAASNNQQADGAGVLRKLEKATADCAGAGDAGISNTNLVCMDASDGKGSCFGDSGGPTFATINGARVVAGVTSGGSGDLCGAGWDLYTSIHAELAFVDSVLGTTGTNPGEPGDPNNPDNPNNPDGNGSGGSGDSTSPDGGIVGGCSTSGHGANALAMFGAVGLLARRRRRRS